MNKDPFIAKDGGFTSVGVAVALLLVMALLFTAAQVRWVQSHSADIQFAADAGALAGGNVVGEYLVVARVADAVVLSLSLFGMATYGIAIVTSCIPYTRTLGQELMKFGKEVFKARDKCAKQAAKGLNALQAALPFLIALKAAAAIEANSNISASVAQYRGLALPLPLQGDETEFPDVDDATNADQALSDRNENTADLADAAKDYWDQMESSKLIAYEADCVSNPRCMYERASTLARLSGGQNPHFSSVDAWLFDYAFNRAVAYYPARLALEAPASSSLADLCRSYYRERFYTYATEEIRRGWCTTAPDGTLSAYFPLMPRNTSEMKLTRLYTERVYPTSADEVIHGVTACPAYQSGGPSGMGSAQDLDNGTYSICSTCDFRASSIGQVASATTNINTGFEYFYHIVANEAARYQAASENYKRATEGAKDSAGTAFDIFKEVMEVLKTPRLKPKPPGHNGVIAIVIDWQTHSIPAGFTNSTVGGSAQLQPRLAIAAVALAEEEAAFGANILASFLDKAKAEAQPSSLSLGFLGVFGGILDLWGSALLVYSLGGDAISDALVFFLDSIPLVSATPLSQWAKRALAETIEALGLQGADLDTPRPLLVNSIHVLRASDSVPATAIRTVKEGYFMIGGSGSGSIGQALVDGMTSTFAGNASQFIESEFVIYEITFGDIPGLPRIPITLRLPNSVVERGQAVINDIANSASSSLGGGGNNAYWR